MIGEIYVENSTSFEGFKITSTPDDYVPSEVITIKGELTFEYIDNPSQWSLYFYRPKFNPKVGNKYIHYALPTGAIPLTSNEEGKCKFGAWIFHYAEW